MTVTTVAPSDSIAALQSALKRSLHLPPRNSIVESNPLRPSDDEETSSLLRSLRPDSTAVEMDPPSVINVSRPSGVTKPYALASPSVTSDVLSSRTFHDATWPAVPVRTAAIEQASNVLKIFSVAASQPPAQPVNGTFATALPPHEQAVLTLKLVKVLCAKHRQVKKLQAALKQRKAVPTVPEDSEIKAFDVDSQLPSATPSPFNSVPIKKNPPIRTRPPRPHVISCAMHTPPFAPHGATYESITSYPPSKLFLSSALPVPSNIALGPVCRVSSVSNVPTSCPLIVTQLTQPHRHSSAHSEDNAEEDLIMNDLRDLRKFIENIQQDLRQTLSPEPPALRTRSKSDDPREYHEQQTQTSPIARNAIEPLKFPLPTPRPRYNSVSSGLAPELGNPSSGRPSSGLLPRNSRAITRSMPCEPAAPDLLPRPKMSVFRTGKSVDLHRTPRLPMAHETQALHSENDSFADEHRRRLGMENYFADLRKNIRSPQEGYREMEMPTYELHGPGSPTYEDPRQQEYVGNYASIFASSPSPETESYRNAVDEVCQRHYSEDHPGRHDDYQIHSAQVRGEHRARTARGTMSPEYILSVEATPDFADKVEQELRLHTGGSNPDVQYFGRSEAAGGQASDPDNVDENSSADIGTANGSPIATGSFESPAERYRQLHNLPDNELEDPADQHSDEIPASSPGSNRESPPSRDYRRLLRPVLGSPTAEGLLSPMSAASPGSGTTLSPVSPERPRESFSQRPDRRRSPKTLSHRSRLARSADSNLESLRPPEYKRE